MALLRSVALFSLISIQVFADSEMHWRNPFTGAATNPSCKAEESPNRLEMELARMPLDQGVILLQQAVKHKSGDPGAEELQTILAEMSNVVSVRATTAGDSTRRGELPGSRNDV